MRMMLFWLVFGVVGWVGAQPGIQWQKTWGGTLNDDSKFVVQTTDGGYILAGATVSDDGDVGTNYGFFDIWLVRVDSVGTLLWKRNYGGSNQDAAYAIRQTPDGGFVVAGFSESTDFDVTGNHGGKDAWVLKIDGDGNIQWQKCLGGSGWEEAWDIQLTLDGGYVLAGRSSSLDGDVTGNQGYLDYWVVKLRADAEIEWQKSLGGSDLDNAFTVCPSSDGGYIVAGESQSNDGDVTGNFVGLDAWVVKLNFEGKIEWEREMGGTGLDRVNEIVQTRDEGFVFIGQTSSNDGDVSGNHGDSYDFWVVKIDSIGNIEWQKALGGSSEDYGQGIHQTTDDGYIVSGFVNSNNGDVTGNHGSTDIWVVKLTAFGEIQWQKAMGGSLAERGYSVWQTTDNGYVVAGDAWSNNGDVVGGVVGKSDYWIVKLAPPSTPTTQPTPHPLNLYPNPATQSITIQIPDTESTLNIQITDLLGRELGRQTIPNGGTVDIESLPNGLYLVLASTESGEVFLGRVCNQE